MWAFLRRKLFYNSCFPDCWICIGKSSNSNLSLKDPRKLYKSWWEFLGLQSRDKVAMLGSIRSILPRSGVICLWVSTMEFFVKEFTWKQSWAPKRENCFYSWPPAWPLWCHVQTSNNIASSNWSQSTVPPSPSFPPAPLMARPDFSSASCTFVVTKTYVSEVRTQWSNFSDLWICLCLWDTGKQVKLATFDFCVLSGFGRKPSLGAPEALLPVIIKHDK